MICYTVALKGFLGKPVLDSGEAMGDVWCVAWRSAHFFFLRGESATAAAAAGLRCGTKETRVQHES